MSGFECKVNELNGNSDKISSFETNTTTVPGANTNTSANTSANTNTNTNKKTESSFSKIINEKNLKAILLIAFVYFLLHSEPVLEFTNAKIPAIISNLTLNSLGKLIFGLLIGVLFIVGSFFFQDP